MENTDSITVGEVNDFQWVRIHGKGNFASSPALKQYVEHCLQKESCKRVVVDLEACPAMDSTFMGTLAGLASRLMERGGSLCIVGLSERNRDSLVDLGLDSFLELEDFAGPLRWFPKVDTIRKNLKVWEGENRGAAAAEEVLAAHRKLCEVDSRNLSKFEAVLEVLEKECSPARGLS